MQLFSWLHKRVSARNHTNSTPARQPTRRFRPQLEGLEARDVPSTLTVTNNLDSGAGSLRGEIAAARSKDTIVFAPSLDGQTIALNTGELDITKNLTIQGPGAGELTVSGNNSSRIFEVPKKIQLSLTGLTISDGSSSNGGGICVDAGGTLTIGNSTLSANTADTGGAIANYGMLTITGCTLSANSAHYGGYGGAISNQATLAIYDSTLSGNSGGDFGGAVFSGSGSLNVSGCTLTNNTALYGGAVYNQATTMAVNGCTISDNTALGGGEGGGIYCDIQFSYGLIVSNSVFTNNAPDNIVGPFTDGGGNTFN